MESREKPTSKEQRRIINLYKGYQYILTHREINKETLKELYSILSDGLLSEYDLLSMGEYYRMEPVYIYRTSHYEEMPCMGMDHSLLDYYMDLYFQYVNEIDEKTEISKFIKSQIMHFYFVYIHPYFDVNGRTSRTLSMWYLLNNKLYPYIIFNQAISFSRREYISKILLSREHGDVTLFLKYILVSLKKELEKEYMIHSIQENTRYDLNKEERQILQYLLTLNGNVTIKDLVTIYNQYNPKRTVDFLFSSKIQPLIDKGILVVGSSTNSFIKEGVRNRNIGVRQTLVTIDFHKLKHLEIKRFLC